MSYVKSLFSEMRNLSKVSFIIGGPQTHTRFIVPPYAWSDLSMKVLSHLSFDSLLNLAVNTKFFKLFLAQIS